MSTSLTIELTSRATLIATSPSRWIVGCTSSVSPTSRYRSEEHTSELQSPCNFVCRLLLEKKNSLRETTSGTARQGNGRRLAGNTLVGRGSGVGNRLGAATERGPTRRSCRALASSTLSPAT